MKHIQFVYIYTDAYSYTPRQSVYMNNWPIDRRDVISAAVIEYTAN